MKSQFWKKSDAFQWGISISCTTKESNLRLQEVRNKRTFQTFSFISAHGHLLEVVAYKSFQIYRFDLETFSVLENWLLTRGGHN